MTVILFSSATFFTAGSVNTCLLPTKIREEYQSIIDLNPDVIITCAYGQFLPKEVLEP